MSLAEVADALSDLVRQFHNDMLRQGVKQRAPKEWLEEFRSWLPSGTTFAEDLYRFNKWLDERNVD